MKKLLLYLIGLTAMVGTYAAVKAMQTGLNCYSGNVSSALCAAIGGSPSSCSPAICGSWGKIFGVSNGTWGTIFHLIILETWIFAVLRPTVRQRLMHMLWLLSLAGVGYSIFFALILTFVVKSPCGICMLFYASAVLNLVLTSIATRKQPGGRLRYCIETISLGLRNREMYAFAIVLASASAALVIFMDTQDTRAQQAALQASASTKNANAELFALSSPPLPGDPLSKKWAMYLSAPLKPDYTPTVGEFGVLGDPNGDVTLFVFTDYECPYCKRLELLLKEAVKDLPGLRVVRKDFPLDHVCNPILQGRSFHQGACNAAVFVQCAAVQGKFSQAHDLIMEHNNELGFPDTYVKLARELGLDEKQHAACMTDKDSAGWKVVQADIKEGVRLNIPGTPWLVLGNRMVELPTGPSELQQLLRLLRGQTPTYPPPLSDEQIRQIQQERAQ